LPEPIINSIYKKICKARKNIDNNRILAYMIEDYDSYFDLDGIAKQELIPNYLEYKYKRIELIIHEVFKNDSDKDLILAVANAAHKYAIENNIEAINQTVEELSEHSTTLAAAMSEAIGGSNIFRSTAVFKYEMTFAFLVNMNEKTIKKTIKEITSITEKSCAIVLKNKCVVCDMVAFSKCGKCKIQTYCSKDCQKEHWATHKHECKSK
jgi:hypothetical protein